MHPAEEPLLRCNVEQLQNTAENAEEVNLQLSKAVKFNRYSGAASDLLLQGGEVTTKLGACIRLVKAVMPIHKPQAS